MRPSRISGDRSLGKMCFQEVCERMHRTLRILNTDIFLFVFWASIEAKPQKCLGATADHHRQRRLLRNDQKVPHERRLLKNVVVL